ncbi:hypothetical protein QAD02_019352 [Eretmocerus hayati]|uniref:Uncharacterized protein n=1 Tax=Eretmocerus hayati TaxID=131215 RepID=A0ACC2PIY3_9HYME|nr:hypothetical protein QAD02_019352 [Eretmocerus hayati]
MAKDHCSKKIGSTARKPLLQTNFSVTGLNEIKTEFIPSDREQRIVLQCDLSGPTNVDSNSAGSRPLSLHLNSTFTTFKPANVQPRPGSMHLERVTTKMVDTPRVD